MSAMVAATATAKLVVYGPQTLVDMFPQDDPTVLANYANFGHIPYGQSLVSPQFALTYLVYYNIDRTNLLR